MEALKAQREIKEEDGQVEGKQGEKKRVEEEIKLWSGIEARRRRIERTVWDLVAGMRPPGKSVAEYRVRFELSGP